MILTERSVRCGGCAERRESTTGLLVTGATVYNAGVLFAAFTGLAAWNAGLLAGRLAELAGIALFARVLLPRVRGFGRSG